MPLLNWDPTDVIECLEVLPDEEEYGIRYGFTCTADGLRLQMDVWPLESMVAISVKREGLTESGVTFWLYVRGRVRQVKDKSGSELRFENVLPLPLGSFYDPYTLDQLGRFEYQATFRLSVKPHIRIELI
ncbi:MAG: hypothetical protein AAF809_06320 [Bacteroidota bacterium]